MLLGRGWLRARLRGGCGRRWRRRHNNIARRMRLPRRDRPAFHLLDDHRFRASVRKALAHDARLDWPLQGQFLGRSDAQCRVTRVFGVIHQYFNPGPAPIRFHCAERSARFSISFHPVSSGFIRLQSGRRPGLGFPSHGLPGLASPGLDLPVQAIRTGKVPTSGSVPKNPQLPILRSELHVSHLSVPKPNPIGRTKTVLRAVLLGHCHSTGAGLARVCAFHQHRNPPHE